MNEYEGDEKNLKLIVKNAKVIVVEKNKESGSNEGVKKENLLKLFEYNREHVWKLKEIITWYTGLYITVIIATIAFMSQANVSQLGVFIISILIFLSSSLGLIMSHRLDGRIETRIEIMRDILCTLDLKDYTVGKYGAAEDTLNELITISWRRAISYFYFSIAFLTATFIILLIRFFD